MGKIYTAESFKLTDGRDLDTGKTNKVIQVIAQTLVSTSWNLVSGFYEYDLANANITSTSVVDAIPDNSSIIAVQVAQVLPRTLSGNGTVKFYAVNLLEEDIIVTLNIWN